MTTKCSICLCAFKEPVSIPCGHVYCTKCLADHVNTGSDDTTSSCPTCRTVFNIVTPDLTYLPKKYHQYVIPGVRRVYLDASSEAILQKKLTKAEARIQKLEAEQETLLKQCEQHMSAARAHAEGEKKERRRAEKLEQDFDDAVASQSFENGEKSRIYIKNIKLHLELLNSKHQELKQICRGLDEKCRRSSNTIPLDPLEYETPANTVTSSDDSVHDATGSRKILPLPRKRAGPLSSSAQPAIRTESTKRPRLSAPGQLQRAV